MPKPNPKTTKAGPPVHRVITPELIRTALASIPPDLGRDTWVRIGMAIKAELGDAGFDLWDGWSQQGATYKAADTRDAWRSIKAGGKTTVATLFGIAKDHGFTFPDADAAAPVRTPEQIEAAQREAQHIAAAKRLRQQAEEAEYRRKADEAAQHAATLWSKAKVPAAGKAGGYAERKRIQPFGLRVMADGTLVVPMRNAAGDLQNVQLIAPKKPTPAQAEAGQLEKRFLSGGRKTGLFHLMGQTGPAPAAVLLAEGVATASTLHEATGRAVAVAFDAGNLVHVARALRALYPAALLLVCGDDDQATEADTGKNPGRDAAAKAARAAQAEGAPAGVVFPHGLPPELSDFNDLAAHAGIKAVRDQVDAALSSPEGPKARRPARTAAASTPAADAAAPAPSETADQAGAAADDRHAATAARNDDGQGADAAPAADNLVRKALANATASAPAGPPDDEQDQGEGDPFFCDELGVWYVGRDKDGRRKAPMRLSDPVHVTAITRDETDNGYGYLIEFTNRDGKPRQWAAPAALFGGEASEWAARLRDMGLRMGSLRSTRPLLGQYIDSRNPSPRVTCVDSTGWHGPEGRKVYVMPSRTIGDSAERRYVFQSEAGLDDTFRRRGSLDGWRQEVAGQAHGNSRILFSLACAFAGPLMGPLAIQTGGIHLQGASSLGKSTALLAACSVWGSPKFKQQWHGTANGVEQVCVQHNHGLLVLDEISQIDGRMVGETVYMIANEAQKIRSSRSLLLRRRAQWRLFLFSSGEKSLFDHMSEAGKSVNEGLMVRLPSLPADAGAGLGLFEVLHGVTPGEGASKAFAEALTAACAAQYGTAGAAWLEWLTEHLQEAVEQANGAITRLCRMWVPPGAHPQVWRVATRFAVVGAAGELASQAGITGWEDGESEWAAHVCFDAWLNERGHAGSGEDAAIVRQVRAEFERNGDALYTWMHRAMDDHRPNTALRHGFKRAVDADGEPLKFDAASDWVEKRSSGDSSERMAALVEYLVFPETFATEHCKGQNPKRVAELLRRLGHLRHEKDRLTNKVRLPGIGPAPVYHFKPSIFADEV